MSDDVRPMIRLCMQYFFVSHLQDICVYAVDVIFCVLYLCVHLQVQVTNPLIVVRHGQADAPRLQGMCFGAACVFVCVEMDALVCVNEDVCM